MTLTAGLGVDDGVENRDLLCRLLDFRGPGVVLGEDGRDVLRMLVLNTGTGVGAEAEDISPAEDL